MRRVRPLPPSSSPPPSFRPLSPPARPCARWTLDMLNAFNTLSMFCSFNTPNTVNALGVGLRRPDACVSVFGAHHTASSSSVSCGGAAPFPWGRAQSRPHNIRPTALMYSSDVRPGRSFSLALPPHRLVRQTTRCSARGSTSMAMHPPRSARRNVRTAHRSTRPRRPVHMPAPPPLPRGERRGVPGTAGAPPAGNPFVIS
jgi:hypothetical protein